MTNAPGTERGTRRTLHARRVLVAACLTVACSSLSTQAIDTPADRAAHAGRVGPTPFGPAGRNEGGCANGRTMTVHFYDVGQALAALVDLPDGRHVLVDTADSPRRSGCADCAAANRHLLAMLAGDLHGAPIDLLWITHQHSDHIGGAPHVLEAFSVGVYADNHRDLDREDVRLAHRAAGRRGVAIRVVDPYHVGPPLAGSPGVKLAAVVPRRWPASCAHDPNECSAGLRIDFCASSVLFTGDAEHDEQAALDDAELGGAVTLLQVAHHGSDTSTTPGFLARTRPKYAVISAGKPAVGLNREYCHPRALVVERLARALGGGPGGTLAAFDGERCGNARSGGWIDVPTTARLWATERDGDVVLTTAGDGAFTRRP
ncbi:MAG: MBL fold metallo-hydrolase [Myxococcota bacterium]|nr:MBL fold metallo-hydrolase [Myxococcota bacterium]